MQRNYLLLVLKKILLMFIHLIFYINKKFQIVSNIILITRFTLSVFQQPLSAFCPILSQVGKDKDKDIYWSKA